ncbi:hypothetical protein JW949_00890 [Candidatus Woesearchaeota archaeon]|nr:hypothetical protein [Candidatus Woesearchaeota archaeon]
MEDLDEVIKKVEDQLSSFDYGFKRSLARSANKEKNSFEIKGLDESEEFECLYYSLKGKELLEKEGIKTDVYSGKDESDIWENHCFLKTEDGTIIDFSPHYKTIGAKHKEGKKISEKEIEQYGVSHELELNNMIPLHHDSKSRSFLRIGLGSKETYGFIRGIFKLVYIDMFKYDTNKEKYVKKEEITLLYKGGKIDKTKKTLKNLIDNGILEIESETENTKELFEIESTIDDYVVRFIKRVL